jgi:hypothetical protein
LVLIVSMVLGAVSAFFLTALGIFLATLIFVAMMLVVPDAARPDVITLVTSAVVMQVAYVATGWLRSR